VPKLGMHEGSTEDAGVAATRRRIATSRNRRIGGSPRANASVSEESIRTTCPCVLGAQAVRNLLLYQDPPMKETKPNQTTANHAAKPTAMKRMAPFGFDMPNTVRALTQTENATQMNVLNLFT
jgi:hypothetical protein